MSIDFGTMYNELLFHTGEDTTTLPLTPDATLLINRSWEEIADKFHFREKEQTAVIQVVAGQFLVPLPSNTEAVRHISIEDPNSFQHTILKKIEAWQYENLLINNPDQSQFKKPQCYVREACSFKLWPTPDQSYNLTVKTWVVLSDLSNTNTAIVVPQVWHEAIMWGAVWRAFERFGDFVRKKEAKASWKEALDSLITVEEKEESDNKYAGLNVLHRDSGYTGVVPGGSSSFIPQDF